MLAIVCSLTFSFGSMATAEVAPLASSAVPAATAATLADQQAYAQAVHSGAATTVGTAKMTITSQGEKTIYDRGMVYASATVKLATVLIFASMAQKAYFAAIGAGLKLATAEVVIVSALVGGLVIYFWVKKDTNEVVAVAKVPAAQAQSTQK
jgi:hypothetical protein